MSPLINFWYLVGNNEFDTLDNYLVDFDLWFIRRKTLTKLQNCNA